MKDRKNSEWLIFLLPHQQQEFKKNTGTKYDNYMKESGYTFGGFISAAFDWTSTEEGWSYWCTISIENIK